MPKGTEYKIAWSQARQAYELDHTPFVFPLNDDSLRSWLKMIDAFHLETASGYSLTARKETKQRGSRYWIAYKRVDGKLHKKYLGEASSITLTQLEAVARSFVEAPEPEPVQQPKTPPRTPNLKFTNSLPSALALFGFPAIPTRASLITRYRALSKQHYVKTQKEGVETLRKAQRELEQGTLVTGPQQTVKQYLEYWLEEVHKSNLKVSSYVKYRKVIHTYIVPALGNIRLEKLTPQHVQSLYNQKAKDGLSSKSINHMHGVLHTALDNAVKWNYVTRNVCEVVSPARLVKPDIQPLTMEQAHKLLESVRGHRLEMLLTLALTTGMRRGEILALRWADVDLEKQLVKVHRTVDYLAKYGYVETEPKTAAGRRTVMLASFVVAMLKQHRLQQLAAKLKVGSEWENRDLVFTDLHGGYFDPRYLDVLYHKVLVEAGLPAIRFHDLRHSAATLLRSMGVDLKVIQEILGHSNFMITANTYSHVFLSMQEEAMGKWDSEFKPDTGGDGKSLEE